MKSIFNFKTLLGIAIVLLLGGAVFWYFFQQPEEIEEHIFSSRAEKFSIGAGGGFPVFTKELVIDPYEVREGEKQYFSIWAKDPEGIKEVTATIKIDKGVEVFELELAEGTEKEGRWLGSWTTKDISLGSSYSTKFRAVNKNGQETKLTSSWYREK